MRDVHDRPPPKDFDVATDALPEEVRRLFRNCRLVGRRFRLAHVVFGREVIEVATFRAASAPSPAEEPVADSIPRTARSRTWTTRGSGQRRRPSRAARPMRRQPRSADGARHDRVLDAHGRMLRDNVYGTIDEDVWRRDFTANALYYNIADFSLWDYVGGAEDIAARPLRLIGDPETRYREDPVRMLRAARFEAKLGFTLDPARPRRSSGCATLLAQVPPARLFDETLKLFLTGHGARSLEVLRRRGLLGVLLPAVEQYLTPHAGSLVEQLLRAGPAQYRCAGRGRQAGHARPSCSRCCCTGRSPRAIESLPPQRWHEIGAIVEACDRALREASARVTMPRRFALGVREMFALQPRLEQPRGRRALRLLEQPRFRAAYDLLLLRAEFGLAPEIAAWWTPLQELGPRSAADARPVAAHAPDAHRGVHAPAACPRARRRRRPGR